MGDLVDVYWLEQTQADVPAENDWLSASEIATLKGLRIAKRHDDWKLGRWTAKRALALRLGLPLISSSLARIEIRPEPSGAPGAFVSNQPAVVGISLSHRAGMAACAVAPSGVKLGCDVELVEPRSDAFIADYFTADEQALLTEVSAEEKAQLATLLWSAKESTLKALREGLRLDTRSVTVKILEVGDRNGWRPLQAQCTDGQTFQGWWRCVEGMVRTLVADPSPHPPARLEAPVMLDVDVPA